MGINALAIKLLHCGLTIKLLHCGLGPHEHNRVIGCKTAKQIWNLLEVTHEGTRKVKRSKIDLLIKQYELFQMKCKESIQEMFTRFTNIINEPTSLGKEITDEEQVRKILWSLPKDRWMAKVTALQETKDFTKFNLEQLVGSLIMETIKVKIRNTLTNLFVISVAIPIILSRSVLNGNKTKAKGGNEAKIGTRNIRVPIPYI